jgi:hypothetical protein
VAPLNFLDGTKTNHFLVTLSIGYLHFKEEDGALRLFALSGVHVIEENQFIVGHAHHSLAVGERRQDFAWTFDDNLPGWGLIEEELFLQVVDVQSFNIFILAFCHWLAEVLDGTLKPSKLV